ncbi:hypothetical protein EWM64_g2646 [Hericium alpestre]|uniref:ZW10 C-terminal helical domain-containing protein n=1 Tax=Hericium alpestre TaxID=135208 RepID=A0A4Z0A547_9AGAM|nr:hypothetical protein EWM64_g2646 [Hericium alpestre]
MSFKQSLCKPLTTALLRRFLIPLLPSALAALPPFLALVKQATDVEERYIVGLLGQDARDREVLHWAEGVATHYERKRRAEILERVREIVVNEEKGERMRVETAAPEPTAGNGQEDSWGFGDEDETAKESTTTVDDDGWGFDDDSVELEQDASADVAQQSAPKSKPVAEPIESTEDTSDAWGWNDDNNDSPSAGEGTNGAVSEPPSTSSSISVDEDSSAWDDDPWADPEVDTEPPIPAPTSPPADAPKPATRLERLAQKSKSKSMHTPQASIDSQVVVPPPPPTPVKSAAKRPQKITVQMKANSKAAEKPPEKEKEVYAVSARAREVAEAVDAALREGREFAASPLFESVASSSSQQRGSVIVQSAPAILDLYCALFPVRFGKALEKSTERTMLFANDCVYLSGYAARSGKGAEEQEKLTEVAAHLQVWGESWFQDAVNQQCEANAAVLTDAEGFEGTADQERFDQCEAAVTRVVGQIRSTSRQWKNVLRKSQYFPALGDVVDSVLAQMLETILALPDITEVESHRLSELCRILNSLEGLFLDNPDQPSSVVAYVPSWLKFSYLSELLEASLADISYLFEEGALVDFEVHELVKLVQALFADTPQRGNIINKLMAGHPQPS